MDTMRGSLKQRSPGSWSIILDLGYGPDPKNPEKLRRKQKWCTVRGTKQEAEKHLTDLLKSIDNGQYVDASKITLGEWLTEWFSAAKVRFRPSTIARFEGIINNNLLTAPIAKLRLQKIRPTHVEQYYAAAKVSASTLMLHHTILHSALKKATKDRLIAVNPVTDLDHKPRRRHEKVSEEAQKHAWNATEARDFLQAAKAAGAQPAAFYALALDSGARKGELCGVRWTDIDLDAEKMRIVQQLLTPGPAPTFGPTKTGRPRTVSLATATVELLRAHRKHQRELMMANRSTYKDHGLAFAKEWSDVRTRKDQLGQPLQANNLGQREYAKLIKAANVRPIKFHGLRHTCATLLLQAGTPVHVVSERLGHSKVSMTMEVYAHVLPDMQRDAATTLGALLHGGR
jgi:integrase